MLADCFERSRVCGSTGSMELILQGHFAAQFGAAQLPCKEYGILLHYYSIACFALTNTETKREEEISDVKLKTKTDKIN